MTKAFGDFLAQRIRPQCLERRIRAGAFIVIQALDDSIRIGAIEQTRRFVVLGCRQPSVGTCAKRKKLGNELDVDQTAGYQLHVPDIARRLFRFNQLTHFTEIFNQLRPVTGFGQHLINQRARLAAKADVA